MIQRPQSHAFALVLVMITIVLAATMAVFFLGSAGRERRGVDLYARGSQVRHLSGMVVNRVIGQISAASKEGTADQPVSWASQPGMIRTYDQNGALKSAYKLYSWDNLYEAGSDFDATAATELPPSGWKANVATFTDLNQAVQGIYPIVDPSVENIVQGFSIDKTNGAVSGAGSDAPMPVKWLYILEDGQMVAPTGGSGNTATIPGASSTNAIIGRAAFWTDDETSKVNVNTASEGAYWDLPKGGSRDELQFSGNTPVKGEFQRVAGHPAMTSLSAVFPELLTSTDRWANVSTFRTQMDAIDKMTPRVRWGGSQGGTYPVDTWNMNYSPAYAYLSGSGHTPPTPITMGADRLYATSDDFWFRPDRQANDPLSSRFTPADFQKRLFFLTAESRAPETTLFETPRISLWPITWPNKSSYYTKRATLSGISLPTVLNARSTAIANNPWTTAEEKLLAFCSTLNVGNGPTGELRYYFQRQNPDSPTFDWSDSSLSRNQDLVKGLRALLDKKIPGFGASLSSKWGATATDQIALNCFDYVRSMVNQFTAPSLTQGVKYSYTGVGSRAGKFVGVSASTVSAYEEPNSKTVVPLNVSLNGNSYLTQGAFPSLDEVAVVFYATQRLLPKPPVNAAGVNPGDPSYKEPADPYNWTNLINEGAAVNYTNGTPGDTSDDIGARTTQMRAVMLLDFAKLVQATDYYGPVFWVKVSGGSFSVDGSPINLPNASGRVVQCRFDSSMIVPKNFMQLFGSGSNQLAKAFTNASVSSGSKAGVWSLVSDPITVNPNSTSFNFGGSTITVEIYGCDPNDVDADPTADSTRLISSKTINFGSWNSSLPIPVAPRWCMAGADYTPTGAVSPSASLLQDVPTLGQPDPYYKGYAPFAALPGFLPARTAPSVYAPQANDPRWALAEYVPLISVAAPAMSDPRLTSFSALVPPRLQNARRGNIPYLFQTSQQATYTKDPLDFDDNNQSSASPDTPPFRISTNFRKRVMSLNQRSPSAKNRMEVYLDGYTLRPAGGDTRPGDLFAVNSDFLSMEAQGLITPYDTVISMVADNSVTGGDPRLLTNAPFKRIDQVMPGSPAAVIPATSSGPTAGYYPVQTIGKQYHHLASSGDAVPLSTGYRILPSFSGTNLAISGADPGASATGELGNSPSNISPANSSNALNGTDAGGLIGGELGGDMKLPVGADWTSAAGKLADGGFLARPNQEYQQMAQDASWGTTGLNLCMIPYFTRAGSYLMNNTVNSTVDVSYFSPNAQIPSPVLLGTIPSSTTIGWQTLAFSPNPAAGNSHPGLANPPDHLLLDQFWMPVAEPYPISDQFATAGKINLNYAMMPFPYIVRKTGLYAALKSTWIYAQPASVSKDYKSHYWMYSYNSGTRTRYPIDVNDTLLQFDKKFSGGDIFRSASQICEISFYPNDPASGTALVGYDAAGSNIRSWWDSQKLTTDNGREAPYDAIYSRITTKSNTYTVHWRVQVLRKQPNSTAGAWDESRDKVVSELRGSTLIERYLDSNSTDIPDYATDTSAKPLSNFYKWRTVSENYFQP